MKQTLLLLIVTLQALLAHGQHCRKMNEDPSTGFCVVPDPNLTPGKMDASLVCVSNRDRLRNVTLSEKKAILKAYGYPPSTDMSTGEFDHWFPHGWVGLMGRRTFGLNRTLERSVRSPRTRWSCFCGGKYAATNHSRWIKQSLNI